MYKQHTQNHFIFLTRNYFKIAPPLLKRLLLQAHTGMIIKRNTGTAVAPNTAVLYICCPCFDIMFSLLQMKL